MPRRGARISLTSDPETFNMDPESLKRCIAQAGAGRNACSRRSFRLICSACRRISTRSSRSPAKRHGDHRRQRPGLRRPLQGPDRPAAMADIDDDVLLSCQAARLLRRWRRDHHRRRRAYSCARCASYRVHGKRTSTTISNERIGMNSRLDTIQAAILRRSWPSSMTRSRAARRWLRVTPSALSDHVETPIVPEGSSRLGAVHGAPP